MSDQQPDIIEVDDINQFVETLEAWHAAKVGTLKGMLEIPEDGGIEVTDPEGNKHSMQGAFARGYKVALVTALGIFGTLPFAAIEPEGEQPDGPTH